MNTRAAAAAILAIVATTCSSGPGGEPYAGPEVALDWSRARLDGSSSSSAVDVTVGGPGAVVVGYSESGDDTAVVWVSSDGRSWTRIDDEPVLGGPGEQSMRAVAVGGPGLVAVGTNQPSTGAPVWLSEDGYTWTRVAYEEEVFDGVTLNDVAVGGPGLVAVGSINEAGGAVIVSIDGSSWTRSTDESLLRAGAMYEVVAGGRGFVARGSGATIWESADGLAWDLVADDPSFCVPGTCAFPRLYSIVAGGPGLVAVGRTGVTDKYDGAVWVSTDGRSWERVDGPFGGRGRQAITAVIVAHPGLIALGSDEPSVGEGFTGAVWVSVDGYAWSRLDEESAFAEGHITSMAAWGDNLVAVGWSSSLSSEAPILWMGQPAA